MKAAKITIALLAILIVMLVSCQPTQIPTVSPLPTPTSEVFRAQAVEAQTEPGVEDSIIFYYREGVETDRLAITYDISKPFTSTLYVNVQVRQNTAVKHSQQFTYTNLTMTNPLTVPFKLNFMQSGLYRLYFKAWWTVAGEIISSSQSITGDLFVRSETGMCPNNYCDLGRLYIIPYRTYLPLIMR